MTPLAVATGLKEACKKLLFQPEFPLGAPFAKLKGQLLASHSIE